MAERVLGDPLGPLAFLRHSFSSRVRFRLPPPHLLLMVGFTNRGTVSAMGILQGRSGIVFHLHRLAAGGVAALSIWGFGFLATALPAFVASPGDIAPRDFVASQPADVVDVTATARARSEAADAVSAPYFSDLELEASVRSATNEFFDTLASAAPAPLPEFSPSDPPPPPSATSSGSDGDEPLPDDPPAPVQLSGVVYADVDDSPGLDDADFVLSGVTVEVLTPDRVRSVVSRADGSFTVSVSPGPALVRLSPSQPGFPTGFIPAEDVFETSLVCAVGADCQAGALALVPHLTSVSELSADLVNTFEIAPRAAETLAELATQDLVRAAAGHPQFLPVLRQATLGRLNDLFDQRITEDQESATAARQRTNPPVVFLPGAAAPDSAASSAVGELVATFFEATYLVDADAWAARRDEAARAVPEVVVPFAEGELIAAEGSRLSQLHLDAIAATSSDTPISEPVPLALLAVLLVGVLFVFLARIRPAVWAQPRLVWMVALLVGLFAASVSVASQLSVSGWFIIPATAFGLMAAVLLDSRLASLLVVVFAFTALVLTSSGAACGFVLLSGLIPVPLVSSASSRREFRTSSVVSAVVASVAAVGLSWFFDPSSFQALPSVAGWAFAAALLSALMGLAALPFFEALFDITTTMRLLDLTDRNHEALQLLQEKAFGTFNHSLMVGTLADAAARAVGANPLLARAMAYYHDLGKTANPAFFIENQVGPSSPHDSLSPSESVAIIRSHVTEGLALAGKLGIPSAVADGIRCHHGDSLIRFFFHRASEAAEAEGLPAPNPSEFRHLGRRPHSAETAIVMLADSVEAASRAVFATKSPTLELIAELVDKLISEKVDDGQLSDAPLTFAQLNLIRESFVSALAGQFHQRVPYPELRTPPPAASSSS